MRVYTETQGERQLRVAPLIEVQKRKVSGSCKNFLSFYFVKTVVTELPLCIPKVSIALSKQRSASL